MFWSFKPLLSPRSKGPFSGCYWITSFEWPPITRLGGNIHYHFPYWIHLQCRLGVKIAILIFHIWGEGSILLDLFNNIYLFTYLFRVIYFILCNIIWLRLQMKMHFGWKPLILWSLHLYDISINGFVQDFLILFFNSTLKWMNVGINF